jgi:hypothetical protein
MCSAAEIWIEQEAEYVREEIASGELTHDRGDPEPVAIAADRVARYLGSISGAYLRNQIAEMKNATI